MDFYDLVLDAVRKGASDIHLAANNRPAYRLHGTMNYVEDEILDNDTVESIIQEVLDEDRFEIFKTVGEADASVTLADCGRFRANAFQQRYGASLVLRVINTKTPELKELNLPASMTKILDFRSGLVIVTGPTGSGKSTTLAALINELNKRRKEHIITIEDPVEFLHTPKQCVINQREIGPDSMSYDNALRAALREDPDIILVGEMRDFETIQIAITAAETGHLVFSTLHTQGSAQTIDRMIDAFPAAQQQQIRVQLSTTLKAVISQRLLPRCDMAGRVGAYEIMFGTTAIANLIREGKTANIDQIISISQKLGMISLESSVANLYNRGCISAETAKEFTMDLNRTEEKSRSNLVRPR